MGFIVWIIFGAIAGWIASMIAGTDARQGALANIIIGIVGAIIGGFIMNILGYGGINTFSIYSLLVAIMGSVIVLWAYKSLARA